MGTDIQRRHHLAGGVVDWHGNRAQPLLQFLIDDAPSLLPHLLQTLQQSLGSVQGPAGLGLQVGMVEVITQGSVVQCRQKNPAHRGAIGRQTSTDGQVHGYQPLGGGRTGDIKNVVAFKRRHITGLMQLFAHAIQIRLRGDGQRRR